MKRSRVRQQISVRHLSDIRQISVRLPLDCHGGSGVFGLVEEEEANVRQLSGNSQVALGLLLTQHCGLASKLPSDFRVVILLQNRALKMKIMIMLTKVTKITCVLTSESRSCFNDDKNGNDNDEDDDDDDDDDDAKRD